MKLNPPGCTIEYSFTIQRERESLVCCLELCCCCFCCLAAWLLENERSLSRDAAIAMPYYTRTWVDTSRDHDAREQLSSPTLKSHLRNFAATKLYNESWDGFTSGTFFIHTVCISQTIRDNYSRSSRNQFMSKLSISFWFETSTGVDHSSEASLSGESAIENKLRINWE